MPPLLSALARYAGQGCFGFHVPGHQQGRHAWGPWRDLAGEAVFPLDLTELPGLDNLHDPAGAIREAQEEAAAFFGAEETFFLVNGTTCGLQAVLLALCRPGDLVLVPRSSHLSIINGLVLSGARPVYLPVSGHDALGVPGMPRTPDLVAVLEGLKSPAALMVLTHPNYYGLVGELQHQIAAAHRYGCPVLVDEAHGAHFISGESYPPTALASGCDYAVQSAHKVLGAFTQASYLHRGAGRESGRLREALRMVQSSSPSYLLMASLDAARAQCCEERGEWLKVAELGCRLRREINLLEGLLAPGEEFLEVPGVAGWDPARLVVSVAGLGISGFEAEEWLRRERRIVAEMADFSNLVFVLTPGSLQLEGELVAGLKALVASAGGRNRKHPVLPGQPWQLPLPEQVLTPREAFFSPSELVPLKDAAGRVAAQVLAPYPPGIPVLCPGEVITPEAVGYLTSWKMAGGSWPGRDGDRIRVVA